MTTRAFKFLASGAISPFARFAWPAPTGDALGSWVVAAGPLVVGKCGAHVCRGANLAHWIHDELWVVELAGKELEARDCLVVARARLVHQVEGWKSEGASRFGAACIAHARELTHGEMDDVLADADQALKGGSIASAAYVAALAVSRVAPTEPAAAYDVERAWQSAWILRELVPARYL
jgi:hypothetical protein